MKDRTQERKNRLIGFVLAWRWPLVATMTLITLLVELEEHEISFTNVSLAAVREVVLFGLFFPGMVGIMLSLMWEARRQAQLREAAAEGERHRIARDLHDSLAQELAFLHLRLNHILADTALENTSALRTELEQLNTVAGQAYLHVRSRLELLHGLPPTDVQAAIQGYAHAVAQRAGFEVDWRSVGTSAPLPPESRREVMLIVAEALANVERHARATRVHLTLVWEPGRLKLTLADDGCGFVPGRDGTEGGMGLRVMQQRARGIGGEFAVVSSVNGGTEVTLVVPIQRLA